ncbi:MAG: AMP-binding protein [Neisseriaceae bacterium]
MIDFSSTRVSLKDSTFPIKLSTIYRQIYSKKLLYEILLDATERQPEKILLLDAPRCRYNELVYRVEGLAKKLWLTGLKTGDCLILLLERTESFLLGLFACFRIGIVPLLALPAYGSHELLYLLKRTSAKTILLEKALLERSPSTFHTILQDSQISLPLFILEQLETPLKTSQLPSWEKIKKQIKPSDPALMLLSGGTTGLPKIIIRSHADYRYNILLCVNKTLLTKNDIYLTALPVAHNFPLACPGILGVIYAGGQLVHCSTPSVEHAFELIDCYQVTMTSLVPGLASLWAEAKNHYSFNLSSLRLIQVGGARFSSKQAQWFDTVFEGKLQQVYGMAEGLICLTELKGPRKLTWMTQGKPISLLDEIKLLHAEQSSVSGAFSGELLTRGPYTIQAYYANPEANKKSFSADGFYKTADKITLLNSGHIIVQGRIDDTIIRAGENIDCAEIEEIALKHKGVAQAVALGLPDPFLGEKVCLIVLLKFNTQALTYEEMRSFFIEQNVVAFKIPDCLVIRKTFPTTASGKIDRKQLRRSLETP